MSARTIWLSVKRVFFILLLKSKHLCPVLSCLIFWDTYITATHYNMIEYIYRHDHCIVKQIAQAFNISPPAVSKQLKFLIANNLIEQQQSSADRRIFNLSVTDQGKFIIDNSENFRETVAKEAAKSLSEEELIKLSELLNKVLTVIKK
ncbi:MarR family winged helix-turn-helix transcriptional regulator [Sphingobacterium sp. InxBP1]|uniref:MarR family winged helix-turn-helix transcriptional regulator n=1 Tax=Sphingobacterium sp. InxBP1 TaxID=2870328 RepID=UPI002ADDCAEB|nr:MarR family transcriptional regulator [Sphingobacterium sp. InxBP1]